MVSRERDTVVVECDGSHRSNRAVSVAAGMAVRRGLRLAVLVVTRGGQDPPGATALRRALELAQRAESHAVPSEPRVRLVTVVDGMDTSSVSELADRAVLLVLGVHEPRAPQTPAVDLTNSAIRRLFHVPMLVPRVRPTKPPNVPHRPHVVVGFDGQGGEEELIGLAASEAEARGWGLVIVRAVGQAAHPGGIARPDVWDETWLAVRHANHTASVSTRVVIAVGEPVAVLIDECGPEDLLVVATRGPLVADSVARGVLDADECDVMVVPPSTLRAARTH